MLNRYEDECLMHRFEMKCPINNILRVLKSLTNPWGRPENHLSASALRVNENVR